MTLKYHLIHLIYIWYKYWNLVQRQNQTKLEKNVIDIQNKRITWEVNYHLTWVESKFNPDSLAEGEEIKVDGVCFYFGSRRFGDT